MRLETMTPQRWFLFVFSVAAVITLSTASSDAQALCGKRGDLIKVLKKRYQESRVAAGLSQKNTEVYEVFVSTKGTWTVLMTTKAGVTCIMATGHSWKDVAELNGDPA